MSILSDQEIIELCSSDNPMISPFEPKQIKQKDFSVGILKPQKVVSYGLSSYGYDVRVADDFKIFTNVNSTVIDPKDFDSETFVDFKGPVCIIPPNSFVLARSVERIHMPRDTTAIVLGKSTYARCGISCLATPLEAGWCFTGDTEVALANGTSISFIDMVERYNKGERFFGYTYCNDSTIGIEELINPRMIKSKTNIIAVIIDNGEKIKCTPDHKFLLKDGTYIEAKDLKSGDRLMPLYRYIDKKGYESVADPVRHKSRPIYTHKLSDEWNVKNNIYPFIKDMVRHHVDFNHINNYPTNIIRMTDSEHHLVHETKEGYSEERTRIGKMGYAAFISGPLFKELGMEIMSRAARIFWDNEEHAATRERWLAKHKEPREYRRKNLDRNSVWEALRETGSIIKAAKILESGATTLYRRFTDLIAEARTLGVIPNNHQVVAIEEITEQEDVYCLEVPNTNNFALEAGVFVHNCGYITLEFANTTPLPAKLYANEGAAQIVFFRGNTNCLVSYADRDGKYQNQAPEVVLPKM